MEEMPNQNQNPQPMVFTKAVANNNDKENQKTNMPALGFFDMDLKMFFIFVLLFIVVLTYFGINLLIIGGNAIQSAVLILSPAATSFLDILGDSTGHTINAVSDVTADVAKTGVDIADGTIKNVGNLLIGEESVGVGPHRKMQDPRPDAPEDSIQKSLSSSKTKWCLVGEYQNKRGCIDISESDKCMSGEVFPNEEMCRLGKPQFQTNT